MDLRKIAARIAKFPSFDLNHCHFVSAVPSSDPNYCKPCRGTGFDSASLEDCPVCGGTGGSKSIPAKSVPTQARELDEKIRKLDDEIRQLEKDLDEDYKWVRAAYNNGIGMLDQKSFYDQVEKTKEKIADAKAEKRRLEMDNRPVEPPSRW